MALEALDLAVHRQLHHPVYAPDQATVEAHVGGLGTFLPLLHGGGEHERHGVVGTLGQLAVELIQRRAGPEGALEGVGLALEAEEPEALLEDHGPAPERGHEEEQDHHLDDGVGLQEQGPQAVSCSRVGHADGADRVGIHGLRRSHRQAGGAGFRPDTEITAVSGAWRKIINRRYTCRQGSNAGVGGCCQARCELVALASSACRAVYLPGGR